MRNLYNKIKLSNNYNNNKNQLKNLLIFPNKRQIGLNKKIKKKLKIQIRLYGKKKNIKLDTIRMCTMQKYLRL